MAEVANQWIAALADSNAAALIGVDLEGRTSYWSPGAESLFGWSADEVRGHLAPIVPPALLQEWHIQMQRVLNSGEPGGAAETQRITRDGRTLTVLRTASVVRDTRDGQVIGLLEALVDVTPLEQLDEESRALAQLRERELVAMDLHDGLIQALYALVLSLATHERDLATGQRAAADALREAREDVQRTIEETREYVASLRGRDFVPRHLAPGLRLLADGLRLNTAIDVQLNVNPGVEALLSLLPAEVRGHVLYLTREAVSNVLRHADATRVRIGLSHRDEVILLKVVDNGRGFATGARTGAGRYEGHGLPNMAERARLIGGRLHVASRPGCGTRVRLNLPVEPSGVAPAL